MQRGCSVKRPHYMAILSSWLRSRSAGNTACQPSAKSSLSAWLKLPGCTAAGWLRRNACWRWRQPHLASFRGYRNGWLFWRLPAAILRLTRTWWLPALSGWRLKRKPATAAISLQLAARNCRKLAISISQYEMWRNEKPGASFSQRSSGGASWLAGRLANQPKCGGWLATAAGETENRNWKLQALSTGYSWRKLATSQLPKMAKRWLPKAWNWQ